MSKSITKEDVIRNKKDAISKLNNLLERYINDKSGEHLKKANLISFWLKDFVRYIGFEESFDPKRNISYKRGDIVKIGFGFNVGSEYGGLHYAVVLDNQNDHASPVVTVIPLTSVKESSTVSDRHNVDLGNEIYRLLKIKCDTAAKSLAEEQEKINTNKLNFEALLSLAESALEEVDEKVPDSPEYKEKMDDISKVLVSVKTILIQLGQQLDHSQTVEEELSKISSEVSSMKQGSIALVGQITTVSKMRIYDPKKSKDVLYGITLSAENMDKINDKVKELYVFSK